MDMREIRSVIGAKGLITMPKEWRDVHGLNESQSVNQIYRMGGALVIIPEGKELSSLENICINILEKGPLPDELKEGLSTLKEFKQLIENTLTGL